MPIWYNPLGTRAIFSLRVPLLNNEAYVFGFNGMVHLEWEGIGVGQVYLEFTTDGLFWRDVVTLNPGDSYEGAVVALGITRVRRENVGIGVGLLYMGGWRFQ